MTFCVRTEKVTVVISDDPLLIGKIFPKVNPMYFSCIPSLSAMGKRNTLKSNGITVVSIDQPNPNQGFRQLFTPSEDQRLKELVDKFGDKEWKYIARCMPGRTTRQCRERYKNYLDPKFKNKPWTQEENQLLIEKYNEIGPKWSQLSQFFDSRSEVNIKNHWTSLSSKMKLPTSKNNILANNLIPNINSLQPLIVQQPNHFLINQSVNVPHFNQPIETNIQTAVEQTTNKTNLITDPIPEIPKFHSTSGIIVGSPLVMPHDFTGPIPPLLKKSHPSNNQQVSSKQTLENSTTSNQLEQLNEDDDFSSISSQVNFGPIKRSIQNSHINVQQQMSSSSVQHDLASKPSVEETSQADTVPINKEKPQKETNSIERSQQPFSVSSLLFTPSLLTNQASNHNADKGFIIVPDSRIDDAALVNEREVLKATFPNFGGQLW